MNPQYNSLPTYAANNPSSSRLTSGICPVHGSKHAAPLLPLFRSPIHSADPLITSTSSQIPYKSLPSSDIREASRSRDAHRTERPHTGQLDSEDTLLERNIVYDRLMSGQVTETGEEPPTYSEAMTSLGRERSASGFGRETGDESESRSRSRLRQSVVA